MQEYISIRFYFVLHLHYLGTTSICICKLLNSYKNNSPSVRSTGVLQQLVIPSQLAPCARSVVIIHLSLGVELVKCCPLLIVSLIACSYQLIFQHIASKLVQGSRSFAAAKYKAPYPICLHGIPLALHSYRLSLLSSQALAIVLTEVCTYANSTT